MDFTVSDYVGLYGALLSTLTAACGIYLYLKRGPSLKFRIVPPDDQRKDRITLVITNAGSSSSTIHTVIWRIFRYRQNQPPLLIREAKFGDSTPYKPRTTIEPGDTQYFPFKFFSEWETERALGFIEVEVLQETSSKPMKHRLVGRESTP